VKELELELELQLELGLELELELKLDPEVELELKLELELELQLELRCPTRPLLILLRWFSLALSLLLFPVPRQPYGFPRYSFLVFLLALCKYLNTFCINCERNPSYYLILWRTFNH
jgi:hypothetical protein